MFKMQTLYYVTSSRFCGSLFFIHFHDSQFRSTDHGREGLATLHNREAVATMLYDVVSILSFHAI